MSKLPEWVQAWRRDVTEGNPVNDLVSALAIAWEALEAIEKHQAVIGGSISQYSATRRLAAEALRRIEELGR